MRGPVVCALRFCRWRLFLCVNYPLVAGEVVDCMRERVESAVTCSSLIYFGHACRHAHYLLDKPAGVAAAPSRPKREKRAPVLDDTRCPPVLEPTASSSPKIDA